MTDLPTELAAEIARVTALRNSYRANRNFSMSAALTGKLQPAAAAWAFHTLGNSDTAAIKAALKDLKGYGNDH